MSAISAGLKKTLIFIHRWMGVFFCLLFSLWFTSGIVMMYWSYPEISAADRLQHAPPLDPSKILLSPEAAFAKLESSTPADSALLDSFDGRPLYHFRFGGGEALVYADSGQLQDAFPPEMALAIAAAWTGQPPASAKVVEDAPVDQWTVSEALQDLRPLSKYSWPDGQQVYVSAATGNVVQYTTRKSRFAAYFGAIPHWLYFTPLRRHGNNWSRTVIWASGLGTVATLLGIIIGVWTFSPSKRYRRAGSPANLPYTGNKRWHAILGLIFGPLACTWVFSGMLSMDPFPHLQGEDSGAIPSALQQAMRGAPPPISAFAAKPPSQAIAQANDQAGLDSAVKQLELTSFNGEPLYIAVSAPNKTRIIPLSGEPAEDFSPAKILEILGAAIQPVEISQARLVTEYESYYLDRHHALPLPVLFIQLNDKDRDMVYIDPATAEIVQAYNANSRVNRWLYHGLHSLNFPALYKYRPAWDILVLALLLGGISLAVTSLLLAAGVLRRN